MKISEHGLNLIKHFEGLRLQAYQCSAGVWTIGYGHTCGVRPGDIIDEAQAGIFLRQDVAASESTVMRFVTTALNQHQFDALVSFVFNLGSGNFAASTLLKKLNASDYAGAADEFPRWVHAAGKPLLGLVRRREAERNLFMDVNLLV
ncbi:lysozyme [Enterobacter cancerogenus]|uniref:lysozyme n=1 Tax=Enterobacter cancerogenus TaxID=69218 RepID=UPI0012996CC3|nr:lysozyme [Enterobacter cancerogenus]QGG11663.1 glycoside hydrolase family protein [Enterobacter cancerogenus]